MINDHMNNFKIYIDAGIHTFGKCGRHNLKTLRPIKNKPRTEMSFSVTK